MSATGIQTSDFVGPLLAEFRYWIIGGIAVHVGLMFAKEIVQNLRVEESLTGETTRRGRRKFWGQQRKQWSAENRRNRHFKRFK